MGRGFCSITVPLDYFSMPLPAAIWGGQPGKEKARNTGQRKPLGVTQGQSWRPSGVGGGGGARRAGRPTALSAPWSGRNAGPSTLARSRRAGLRHENGLPGSPGFPLPVVLQKPFNSPFRFAQDKLRVMYHRGKDRASQAITQRDQRLTVGGPCYEPHRIHEFRSKLIPFVHLSEQVCVGVCTVK